MDRGTGKKRKSGVDIAAVAVCVLLFGYLFYSVNTGVGLSDEHWYFTMPLRFLRGDRIFVDDWHITQLSAVVQLLPCKLYTLITGGTEGILLFMRRLFVLFDLFCYWFYYLKLRRYGVAALAGSALMCSYVHLGAFTFSYTALPPHFLALSLVLLTAPEDRPSLPALIVSGVLLSCAVLCQPTLAFAYLLFAVFAVLRMILKKRGSSVFSEYDFIFNGRVFGVLTLTAAVSAAVVVIAVCIRSGLHNILDSVPEIFNDAEYEFSAAGNTTNAEKVKYLLNIHGAVPLAGLFALIPVSALVRKLRGGKRLRFALFLVASALTLGSFVLEIRYCYTGTDGLLMPYRYAAFPLLPFGLICYILQEKKDRRIFAFWLLAFASSLTVDLFSHITLGFGGRIALFSAAYSATGLLRELFSLSSAAEPADGADAADTAERALPERKKPAASDRALVCTALLLLCGLVCADAFNLYLARHYFYNDRLYSASADEEINARIETGPLRGIRTAQSYKNKYNDVVSDLDAIRAVCDGPVYIAEKNPWFYLYLDLPIGAPTPMYIEGNSTERLVRYWQAHPENRPAYIYAQHRSLQPKQLSFLSDVCDFHTENGKAGILLRVDRWKI